MSHNRLSTSVGLFDSLAHHYPPESLLAIIDTNYRDWQSLSSVSVGVLLVRAMSESTLFSNCFNCLPDLLLGHVGCIRLGLLQSITPASVSLCGTWLCCANTTERIEILLGVRTSGAQGTLC